MAKFTINDEADFTWDFGQNFLLQTKHGLYLWSDPDYGGDNTIRPFKGTMKDYFFRGGYGRAKGKHVIASYCGEKVKIIEKE